MRAQLPDDCLVLVPTEIERSRLAAALQRRGQDWPLRRCGFGPLSAAVGTMVALSEKRWRHVILVGIAGAFDEHLVGTAVRFGSVVLDGIGLPQSDGRLLSGHDAGFDPSCPKRIDGLAGWPHGAPDQNELLTVCVPSRSPDEARRRRGQVADGTGLLAEDMEGFGVALACRQYDLPLTIVRGISNQVGQRDHRGWRIDEALEAVAEALVPPT